MLAEASRAAGFTVGFSTKAYFSDASLKRWLSAVADQPDPPDVLRFLVPSHPSLRAARERAPESMLIGAQNVSVHMPGPYTGEVTAELLAEVGADFVELGHAEHRSMGDSDAIIARKAEQAISQGLDVLLCVGEPEHVDATSAAKHCAGQVKSTATSLDRLVIAYEPVWAIGSSEPASSEHIIATLTELKSLLGSEDLPIIYGGTAGPGLLSGISSVAKGLFLGRRAHDPEVFGAVVEEATALIG